MLRNNRFNFTSSIVPIFLIVAGLIGVVGLGLAGGIRTTQSTPTPSATSATATGGATVLGRSTATSTSQSSGIQITDFFVAVSINTITTGLISLYVKSLVESNMKYRYDVKLEDYKNEIIAKQQILKVAELIAGVISNKSDVQKLNQLVFELSLYLPADQARNLNRSIYSFQQGQYRTYNFVTGFENNWRLD